MFSKIKIHRPDKPIKEKIVGILLHVSDKYGEHCEPYDLDQCARFKAKHNLAESATLQDVGREMVKFYNKGLRPHDNKRKCKRVYLAYEGIYYSSKKL
jgi:hypothetical protein